MDNMEKNCHKVRYFATKNSENGNIAKSGNNTEWLTSARKPFEIKVFRAFYILMKMTLQHFCNTQCEFYKKEWLQVAIKFI